MYNVSTDYKNQISNLIRNPSYIKIFFGVTDPQALPDSSVTDNGGVYWSNSGNVTGTDEVTVTYETMEHNRLILDGKQIIPIPDGETQPFQGFISFNVSDIDGKWEINPTITISFQTLYFSFAGLSITFDSMTYSYPSELKLNIYKDDVLVQEITTYPDNYTIDVKEAILECNKIQFEAVNSGYPFRRFRMENLFLGVRKVFTDSDIVTANWKREVDLINAKQPINEFNFTILDKDREYDPENVTGIYAYIEDKQECIIQIGYELDSGTIEWQPISTLFTTGELKINTDVIIPLVAFKTQGILAFLTTVYTEGKYYVAGRTLYDLAIDVLTFANIPKDNLGNDRWYVDPILANYTSFTPLSQDKCNVLLQDIANAGMCVMYIDRNGYINVKQKNDLSQIFTFTRSDVLSIPTTSKYPVLQGVDTFYNTVVINTTVEVLGTYDIVSAVESQFELSYESAYNVTAVAGAGLTIIGTPEYYSQMCRIVLTGTGVLTISGKKITMNKVAVSVEYNTLGDRCPIENSLLTNPVHANIYATWIGNYINRRIEYEFQDRGFPEIDVGDSVKINTLYTDDVEIDVLSSEIEFNGSISGKTKVLKK